MDTAGQTSWVRDLVNFALDQDVSAEIARLQAIIAAHPESAKARYDLGVLHYSQGMVYEAIGEFLMAIEINPLYARAYRQLGDVYVNLGDYRQAGKYALKAAELGDRSLLESFSRYPATKEFVETS